MKYIPLVLIESSRIYLAFIALPDLRQAGRHSLILPKFDFHHVEPSEWRNFIREIFNRLEPT